MTARIPIGIDNHEYHVRHTYYVELIDGPHAPIYVHAWQEIKSCGHIQAAISYQPLTDAVGQPFHDEACSVYLASLVRV